MIEQTVNEAFIEYAHRELRWQMGPIKNYRGVGLLGTKRKDGTEVASADVKIAPTCAVDHQIIFESGKNLVAEGMGDGDSGSVGNHLYRLLITMSHLACDGGAYLCLPSFTWKREKEHILFILSNTSPQVRKNLRFFVVAQRPPTTGGSSITEVTVADATGKEIDQCQQKVSEKSGKPRQSATSMTSP